MPSALSQFLITEYAPYFGTVWDSAHMVLRAVSPASVVFEILDKVSDIVQPSGHGVSVIRRNEATVEVVDFENFCSLVHGANPPRACDFIISPEVGYDYIVLNELTHSNSNYIRSFIQPETGEQREGKLDYARQQLSATIERIYLVSNHLDAYAKKVALFSCRLSDKTGNGPMARSARAFNSTIRMLEHMRLHEYLGHGFVFEMRVYNKEYRLQNG